jgi:2-hydroxychromene-2-carboxylate isomerase
MSLSLEPDNRPPEGSDKEPDWDKLDASYEAPGAREAVPDLPPVPDVTTPAPTENPPWTWTHFEDGYHKPQKEFPAQLRDIVVEENPLEVDVFYSMRSPYSYLSLFRLAYLHSNYNVNVNIKVIFPVAVRTRKKSGKAGSGRWYFYGYSVHDASRVGRYEGIPFRLYNPDPILQDTYPQGKASGSVAPMEKQPYIAWVVRLAAAAQLEGKTLDYVLAVSPLIFGARAPLGAWPLHVEEAVNSIGMNYGDVIKDIKANPDKYDDVWSQNAVEHQATGQGGVPTMSWNGEPFFGEDRFNHFFSRLNQNGLTVRKTPRGPHVSRPLRWPSSPGGV